MIVYLIQSTSADGPPLFYDPAAGRNTGHGINGWVAEKHDALAFATEKDAKKFIEALLPRMTDTCRPFPCWRED